MSIYVDPLFNHEGSATFRWKRSCHMYADSLDELHSMALNVGMKLAWFQDKPTFPHYDLVPLRRAAAVKLGAIEHTREEMVKFTRDRRDAHAKRIKIAWIPFIEEHREVFECEHGPYYYLDPGDGLGTHIKDGDGIEVKEMTEEEANRL